MLSQWTKESKSWALGAYQSGKNVPHHFAFFPFFLLDSGLQC